MEIVVRTAEGVEIDRMSSETSSGCAPGSAWADFFPQRVYPHRARICGFVYENGALAPGHPCETVLGSAAPC
jgi:hypothetical protein